jgi:hypothetical protein
MEVIVVDDGSTDGSLAALAPFRNRIRILSQENRGVACARNKGVAEAGGTFIAFLDADDWWLRPRLAAQFAALDHFPEAGLVFSDFCVVDSDAVPLMSRGIRWKYGVARDASVTPWNRVFSRNQTIVWTDSSGQTQRAKAYSDDISGWLFRGNFILTSSVLARRETLLKAGRFDESLSTEEDYDCWLRMAEMYPMAFVDVPLAAFRRREGQLTSPERIETVLRNVTTVVERAAGRVSGTMDPNVVRRRLSTVRRNVGIAYIRSGRNREARRLLCQSLKTWPPHALTLILMPLSFLPTRLFVGLECGFRALRRRLRRYYK